MNLLLLISILGVLAFTATDYVVCNDDFPDEFLDLAVACSAPVLPVFAPQLNIHPDVLKSLNAILLQKVNFLTSVLRC
ncbi:MAG TPA: hypothetical protein VLZ10_11500 [Thermodesulfobacteriota bacterium]|nr:hypothetical protein [Thermodesulfobacteriota bacterium]